MADEASDTFSGGLRNFLGALGFILPLGGVEELIRHFADPFHPSLPWWASIILIAVGMPIYQAPAIWKYLHGKVVRPPAASLQYLRHRDSELSSAILEMSLRSAWARWYAAQQLANTKTSIDQVAVLNVGASHVIEKLMNGELEARGRLPEKMGYEIIPQTHWRSSIVHFVFDSSSPNIWRMEIIPRVELNSRTARISLTMPHRLTERPNCKNSTASSSILVNLRNFGRCMIVLPTKRVENF
jgi:hypothetical protein